MPLSSSSHFLFLSLLIAVLSVTVSAGRPCKTLLITSYSVSFKPLFSNPNHQSSGFIAVFTEITPAEIILTRRPFFPRVVRVPGEIRRPVQQESLPSLPFASSVGSYNISSLRERTKDILSVVVALLFGVGCGALTAASMYLVRSVFTRRSASYEFVDEESDEDDDDDVANLKKLGYVKIPAAEAVKA